MKKPERLALTLLLTALSCAAQADGAGTSRFDCALKPGGTDDAHKIDYVSGQTDIQNPSRIAERMEEIEFELSVSNETALNTVGDRQEPLAVTVAEVQCKW